MLWLESRPAIKYKMNEQLLTDLQLNESSYSFKNATIAARLSGLFPHITHKSKNLTNRLRAALFILESRGDPIPVCEVCSASIFHKFPHRIQEDNFPENRITKYGNFSRVCSASCNRKLLQPRIEQTWLMNHGAINPMKKPEIAKTSMKNRKTDWIAKGKLERRNVLLKWGVDPIIVSNLFHDKERDVDILIDVAKKFEAEFGREPTRTDLSRYSNIPYQTLNDIFYKSSNRQELYYAKKTMTQGTLDILDFIRSLGFECRILVRDKIAPLELDIYVPEKNLAIEFNGMFCHGEEYGKKDKNYHLNKVKRCEELGINLLHVIDVEWYDPIKKEIWKSIIAAKLNRFETRVFARKCELQEISSKESRKFLDENHLQGFHGAHTHLALIYDKKYRDGFKLWERALWKQNHLKEYNRNHTNGVKKEHHRSGWYESFIESCKKNHWW
jgi:hypothetical protein